MLIYGYKDGCCIFVYDNGYIFYVGRVEVVEDRMLLEIFYFKNVF